MSQSTRALPRERWVYCRQRVLKPSVETDPTDGFKRRYISQTYRGYILEEFEKDDEGIKRLQPTGEWLDFKSYWLGTIEAGSLIYVRQDPNDGVYKVFGGECAGD